MKIFILVLLFCSSLFAEVFSLPEGKVKIQYFKHYVDPEQSGVSVGLKFTANDRQKLNFETSPYRWVQTVKTNFDADSDYKSDFPRGSFVEFLDISDLHTRSFGSITYEDDSMTIEDILGRIPQPFIVDWEAETSLIRVNSEKKFLERLITIKWGFIINPDTTSKAYEPKIVKSPSSFHLEVLENNLKEVKRIVQKN